MSSTPSKSAPAKPISAPRQTGPGRPKDLGKRAAILEAAKHMFVRHGFEGVSMDQIAAEAGVSKLTVYSHFGDKETLFSEAISAKCEEQLSTGLFALDPAIPLRDRLLQIGRGFFALITSTEALAIHRVVTTQPPPAKLGQLFWEAGPRRVQEAFEAFLREEVAAGTLQIPDLHRAASQFFCLLKGEPHMRLLCGCCDGLDAQEVDAHLQATVDLFLRAHAVRSDVAQAVAVPAARARRR